MKRIGFLALWIGWWGALYGQMDPAAREDEEAQRKKMLRAMDQIEVLSAGLDAMRIQNDALKGQIEQLKTEQAALRTDLATTRADAMTLRQALEKLDAARAQERKVLLEEVSKIIAESARSKLVPEPSKPDAETRLETPTDTSATHANEKGFYYTVNHGDTLSAVAKAYQAQGVNVTVADIRKANNLTKDQAIRAGQKLFIPKK